MKWTIIPAGELNAAEQRLRVAFGDHADAIVSKINGDSSVAPRIASLVLNNDFGPSISQKRAREIMGRNFFGVEEAIKHFGVNPSRRQLAVLGEVPFSEETLTVCKDTHVLVAVFPISIVEIRGNKRALFSRACRITNQEFANDAGEIGWQLVHKVPIGLPWKTWGELQGLLSKDEETPKAQVMVYTIIGFFLATGERLFEKVYVRCVDLDSNGDHVSVGQFGAKGMFVSDWSDGGRRSGFGVSSVRK